MTVIAHPLGPPTVSGNLITVDTMLNQPTRITKVLMDLTLQKFIMDKVFSNGGAVSGGAVVYDQTAANELYTSRDVEKVAAGAEFPVIDSARRTSLVATVDKWGGKVYITDEARDRNNSALFANQIKQLANTLVRKLNAITVSELLASVAAEGQTLTGVDWNAVITAGTSASSAEEYPMRDFIMSQNSAETDELGVVYDLYLLNPIDYAQLAIIYGPQGVKELLASMGMEVYTSNRVTAGSMLAVASGQVGEYRLEKPLTTETWRDAETETNWIQASVRPVFYVTNPYAVLQVTGI